jgi:hypothetical protein
VTTRAVSTTLFVSEGRGAQPARCVDRGVVDAMNEAFPLPSRVPVLSEIQGRGIKVVRAHVAEMQGAGRPADNLSHDLLRLHWRSVTEGAS